MQYLNEKIQQAEFPCVMAKAVMNQGHCKTVALAGHDEAKLAAALFENLGSFVETYRANSGTLHSFVASFSDAQFAEFEDFEAAFWKVLQNIRSMDDQANPYDPRVSSDPQDGNFSFSVKGEAFFILLLHPKSPRKARQFSLPSIVFNPHQQFEDLRERGTFFKVRSLIRSRDEKLQGSVNPMLMDYGTEVSEIFQYSGRERSPGEGCPFRRKKDAIAS